MRKGLIVFITLLVLTAAIWLVGFPTFDRLVYRQQFEQSERLINAIEAFELEHGHLPSENEVTELKIELGLPSDERCPCYQVEGLEQTDFIVWFGYQTTGSSMVYDSHTAEWSPRH